MEWYVILLIILIAAAITDAALTVMDENKNRKEKHK